MTVESDFLTRAQLVDLGISFSRQHLLTLMKSGQFPKQINIGSQTVVWAKSEVVEWLDEKKKRISSRVKPEPEANGCDTCRFFHLFRHGHGVCRRYPPVPSVGQRLALALSEIHWVLSKGGKEFSDEQSLNRVYDGNDHYGEWPYVSAEDWCGEYQREDK